MMQVKEFTDRLELNAFLSRYPNSFVQLNIVVVNNEVKFYVLYKV